MFASDLSALFASIPSPGFNSIGPFTLYGLSIAIGAALAVTISGRRWEAMGGHQDDMPSVAMWGIPAGVVGARAYHVITDFQRFSDGPWYKVFQINEGGLGIPGGMALGIIIGLWAAKRRGMNLRMALDAAVPGLPLAQAVGRLGNYFNQELYGRPTTLPWGLEIDGNHRGSIPEEWRNVEAFPTFHPTFLYELLWNLALTVVLLRVDAKKVLPRGRLIAVYLLGYGLGRLWIEAMRIDTVNKILGLRINIWMSAALIIAGLAIIFWPGGRSHEEDSEPYGDSDNTNASTADATDAPDEDHDDQDAGDDADIDDDKSVTSDAGDS